MNSRRQFGIALALLAGFGETARAADPVLTPGSDPGGTAVALLADGFDYTRPEMARILARDGEGEAIAWDDVDKDHRPFVRDGAGTAAALAATQRGGVRIVAVRVDVGDPASLAQGVAFVTGTPARVIVIALDAETRARLDMMAAAAKRFESSLFVVSVPRLTAEEAKLGDDLANLLVLDAADRRLAVAETVGRALGCGRAPLTGAGGAELKQALLDRLREVPPAGCAPESGRGPE